MSVANYGANSQHHAQILICVQIVGNLQPDEIKFALAKLRKHERLTVADAGRNVHFRFEVDVPSENSKWGFFQVHRRALGLVMLAGCSSAMDVALLHETFQRRREEVAEFIFDVRCFVFGVDNALMQQNKGEVFQFSNVESWKTSDRDVKQFLTSVFYVLESKRLQMAADKSDRPTLLTAPFEQTGDDSDSRSFRKKCAGRWKKHLADVSLISGLMMDALQNYHSALDSLISANDQLWIGGCLEGLCVASAIFLYPEKTALPRSPVAKNFNKQVLDPRNLLTMKLAGSHSNTDIGRFCIQKPDDFVDRYKEAVINYSRSSNMGVIELEACIKATKVMAILNKPMQASEFLQNAVYITIDITDEERILRYSVLADLYADINFHRKSAFYKRVAAMQCVSPHLSNPNWAKCFELLQDTLQGYNLNFDEELNVPSIDCEKGHSKNGWPNVRLRVLHEVIYSSQKVGKVELANRYRLYLLMKMHEILSENEEREICSALPTAKSEPEKDQTNNTLPPINLYKLPMAREVAPQPLSSNLTPTPFNQSEGSDSVFLFAPSSYHANKKKKNKIEFEWCANTACEVLIHIHNPLKANPLHMSNFKLICEGSGIDYHPISVVIPPCSTVEATLVLAPTAAKPVKIIGYQFTTFGLESFCYFRNMPWLQVSQFEVNVTPELPVLQKDGAFLSPINSDRRSKLSVALYPGETKTISVPFSNVSRVPITRIESETIGCKTNNRNKQFLATTRKKKKDIEWLKMSCDVDKLPKVLPLSAGAFLKVPIKLQVPANDGISCLSNNNNDDQLHSCQVKIKYSGEKALELDYGRVAVVRLNATLQPGVQAYNVKVQPAAKQGWCAVLVSVRNCSNELVHIFTNTLTQENLPDVSISENIKTIEITTINSQDDKVLVFLLPTFHASLLRSSQMCTDSNLKTETKTQNVLGSLQKYLGLNWKIEEIGGDHSIGHVNVSMLEISQESLFNLIQSPIHWTVFVNGSDVTTKQHCRAGIGEPCPVLINIKNNSDGSIPLVDLEVEVYQDQCNGFKEWDMDDNAMFLGCRRQSFENLDPGESVEFECSLVFLLVGEYYVRVRRLSPHDDNICGFWKKDLKKTFSNQSISDNTSFREFSPKAIIKADFK